MIRVILFMLVSLPVIVSSSRAWAAHVMNDYLIMDSAEEAVNWFTAYEVNRLARRENRPPRPIAPPTDARYHALVEKVRLAWSGLRKIYPAETEGLSIPEVVLVEDSYRDAFSLYDASNKYIPFLFVVNDSLLQLPDDQQVGIFIHELTHLGLKHQLPGNPHRPMVFYRAPVNFEPFGFQQANDLEVQNAVTDYIRLAKAIGPFSRVDLHGFPADPGGQARYYLILRHVLNLLDFRDPACVRTRASFINIFDLVESAYWGFAESWRSDARLDAELGPAVKDFFTAFRECAGATTPNLIQIYAERFNLEPAFIRAHADRDDLQDEARFNQETNLADAFAAVGIAKQAEMRAMEDQLDFGQFRIYSFEEQADDASVRVMIDLGLNPLGQVDSWFHGLSEAELSDCAEHLASGRVPNYGHLSTPHRSNAYRIYHARALAAAIRSGQFSR